MTTRLAALVVLLAGLYLIGLAGLALVAPDRARRLLGGFAGSARAHFLELGLRAVVGLAMLLYSPHMLLAAAFRVFGWILVISTFALAAVPWRWHQRFAGIAVPMVTRRLWLLALGSSAMGVVVVVSVVAGPGFRTLVSRFVW